MWNPALQPLKISYLHYHNANGHQAWKGSNLSWRVLTHKVTWSFDHVVSRDHAARWEHYISTARVLMATNLGGMVTYLMGLRTMGSHYPLIACSCGIAQQVGGPLDLRTAVAMATGLGRVVAYNGELPLMEYLPWANDRRAWLQWLTGYLGLTLVFVGGSAQREKCSFCFSKVFC